MPYPELMVRPMREELVNLGVEELTTPEAVEQFMQGEGSAMLVFNSVCGCAAGSARPAVAMSLDDGNRPDRVATVFAGQDVDAVAKARTYFPDFPPSSPSVVLIKDGQPAHYLPRHMIEGRTPQEIATDLKQAFAQLNS